MNKILANLVLIPFLLVGCATSITPEQQEAYQQLAVTTGVSYAVMAYIEQSDNPRKTALQIINFIDYALNSEILYIDISGLSPKDKMLVNTVIQVVDIQMQGNKYVDPVNANLLKQLRNLVYIYTI